MFLPNFLEATHSFRQKGLNRSQNRIGLGIQLPNLRDNILWLSQWFFLRQIWILDREVAAVFVDFASWDAPAVFAVGGRSYVW